MNTNCPHCGSKQTQARDVAYKTGTSETNSTGIYAGVSIGRRSSWLGTSNRTSTRHSLFAKESAPFPLVPPIFLIVFMLFFFGEIVTFIFILSWVLNHIRSSWNYEDEWICRRCGTKFIPSVSVIPSNTAITMNINNPAKKDQVSVFNTEKAETTTKNTANGKSCSICGTWFPSAEFSYGNRENRSYCQKCNVEERKARAQGGGEAAKEFRNGMREKSG